MAVETVTVRNQRGDTVLVCEHLYLVSGATRMSAVPGITLPSPMTPSRNTRVNQRGETVFSCLHTLAVDRRPT